MFCAEAQDPWLDLTFMVLFFLYYLPTFMNPEISHVGLEFHPFFLKTIRVKNKNLYIWQYLGLPSYMAVIAWSWVADVHFG